VLHVRRSIIDGNLAGKAARAVRDLSLVARGLRNRVPAWQAAATNARSMAGAAQRRTFGAAPL
jgi:hypothetical protein